MNKITDHEKWLLSFYRTSEISGALFFGRLAKVLRDESLRADMTKHFADESQHAWYWTRCLEELGHTPDQLKSNYQERYLDAAGMPVNMMEVLAITQVFERRVIGQYGTHLQIEGLRPEISKTIQTIMEDEKWHIEWVGQALKRMEPEYGKETIQKTLQKYWKADKEVYAALIEEHDERMRDILGCDPMKHQKSRLQVGDDYSLNEETDHDPEA